MNTLKKGLTRTILIITAGALFAGCMTTGRINGGDVPADTEYTIAGEVTIETRVWNPLFLKSAGERRNVLIKAANGKAKEEYGGDAILANLVFKSRWSPYSLLLGLDLIGFAEDATLTADVLLPVPPPQKPAPDLKSEKVTRISYPILPHDRYDDAFGYIGLEYLTRSEVLDQIKTELDKRNADGDHYAREYAKVPEGGNLIVNIGRGDLTHANTRWYSYTILKEGKRRIERRGAEGIPNIKGRDGNWWNVVIIPLEFLIEKSIEVRIADTKENLVYTFSVTRLEEVW